MGKPHVWEKSCSGCLLGTTPLFWDFIGVFFEVLNLSFQNISVVMQQSRRLEISTRCTLGTAWNSCQILSIIFWSIGFGEVIWIFENIFSCRDRCIVVLFFHFSTNCANNLLQGYFFIKTYLMQPTLLGKATVIHENITKCIAQDLDLAF